MVRVSKSKLIEAKHELNLELSRKKLSAEVVYLLLTENGDVLTWDYKLVPTGVVTPEKWERANLLVEQYLNKLLQR